MDRTVRNRNQLPNNLPQLQNLIKRDRTSYKDEFLQQYHHYQALLQLFLLNPAQESEELRNLVMFLCQICGCYGEELRGFPGELMELLRQHGPVLEPEVRMTLCRGLILMRNKDFIEPQGVLELFFELFRCQDKILRKALFSHIVTDVKRINLKRRNNRINLALQNMMYGVFRQSSAMTSRMALNVMTQLYKKNIWKDTKTVNVVATACFSPVTKICVAALQFFLTGEEQKGDDEEAESSSDEEDEAKMMRTYIVAKQVTKKGKKRERKMKRALATIKKKSKQKKKAPQHEVAFSALHLLNDPQDFTEKLFHKLERSKDKFEIRMMMMSLVSRLIGLHQLVLFNYYPFLQRYVQPHQKDVTKILTYLAQAAHKLVPPEILEVPLRAIVNNFVSERNSSEVMAVGLNAVREVCVRCPLVMSGDLLQDLAEYRTYRDKSVMMAARSLIHLFRELNPDLLKKKDRGRPTEASALNSKAVSEFGALDTAETIPGAEDEILSQEQFEELRVKELNAAITPSRGKKRQLEDMLKEQEERREEAGELLSESAINTVPHAKRKRTKEDRVASIQEGREGREKFGSKRRKLNPHSSTTNKQKAKKKAFTMIKHKRSIRGKNKKSFREKQISLRNSLLKQKRRK